MSYASLPLDYQWLVLGCARFAKNFECVNSQKTWSSGATECRVWIGNYNVKVWKTTEHTLHKIWCSLKFCKMSGKRTHPRNAHYKSFPHLEFWTEQCWDVLVFAEMLQKLYGVPGFWDNVLDSFTCFNIETAYSSYTFSCTYTLSFLVAPQFQQNEHTPDTSIKVTVLSLTYAGIHFLHQKQIHSVLAN